MLDPISRAILLALGYAIFLLDSRVYVHWALLGCGAAGVVITSVITWAQMRAFQARFDEDRRVIMQLGHGDVGNLGTSRTVSLIALCAYSIMIGGVIALLHSHAGGLLTIALLLAACSAMLGFLICLVACLLRRWRLEAVAFTHALSYPVCAAAWLLSANAIAGGVGFPWLYATWVLHTALVIPVGLIVGSVTLDGFAYPIATAGVCFVALLMYSWPALVNLADEN